MNKQVNKDVDIDAVERDVQGNILRSYSRHLVRHLMLEVTNVAAARRFLGVAANGGSDAVPAITPGSDWGKAKPPSNFNIGLTFEGLKALGVSRRTLQTFPVEFSQGMTKRAIKIGDFGNSAPDKWPAPFDTPEKVHIVASIHADEEGQLDKVEAQVAEAFTVLGVRDGRGLGRGKVFFGYKDSISQPRFKWVKDRTQATTDEPLDPLGTILLGYPTSMEDMSFRVPYPDALGLNGSFNAFRILAQASYDYEIYLDEAADFLLKHKDVDLLLPPGAEKKVGKGLDRHAALREIVAAQMCGRWRNGTPYETSPDTMNPDPDVSPTNFDYSAQSRCPAGAHMRRANPRGGHIVQRIATYTRRLVRRGMSYGPDFDPDDFDRKNPDRRERGLLGNFLCANLGAQFEAVMCDWLNVGLQTPSITGTNDPLLGANTAETSRFDLTLPDNAGTISIYGFPRFVTSRGGAYTFLPSLTAIRYLSEL